MPPVVADFAPFEAAFVQGDDAVLVVRFDPVWVEPDAELLVGKGARHRVLETVAIVST